MIGLHAFLFLFKRSIYSVRKWHNSNDTQHTYSHLLSAMIVSIILELEQKQTLLSRKSMEVQMNRNLKYYKGKGIMIEKSWSYLFCFEEFIIEPVKAMVLLILGRMLLLICFLVITVLLMCPLKQNYYLSYSDSDFFPPLHMWWALHIVWKREKLPLMPLTLFCSFVVYTDCWRSLSLFKIMLKI